LYTQEHAERCYAVIAEAVVLSLRAHCRDGVLRKELRMEREGGFEVRGEVGPVVAAGIEMEFVGNSAGDEDFVESGGAGVEPVIVFGAAVEIDFQSRESSGAAESERAVALPKGRIGRQAEDAAEDASAAGSRGAAISGEEGGKFFDEGGAMSAYGRE
jgi:hypothetical protein